VQVHNNLVLHTGAMQSYASIMMDNAQGQDPPFGDFTGAAIHDNSVNCNYGMPTNYYGCDFGLNVGPYAWFSIYTSGPKTGQWIPHIFGGEVYNNNVWHAKQGLLMAGAGTAANPTNVDSSNAVSGSAYPFAGGFYDLSSHGNANDPAVGCALPGQGRGTFHLTSNYNADPGTVVNDASSQPGWTFNVWENCY